MTKVAIAVCLIAVVFLVEQSFSLTDKELKRSKVTKAQYYKRPIAGSPSGRKRRWDWNWRLYHTGVVVTITDTSRWLIHKGKGYGDPLDTVIVSASGMTSKWTLEGCRYQCHNYVVEDFMLAGRKNHNYNLITNNCQRAANCMWHLLDDCSPCSSSSSHVPVNKSTCMPQLYWLYVLLRAIPVMYMYNMI